MKPFVMACMGLLSLLASHVCAAAVREIELTDGSMILAEVVALQDGVYTLKSDTLGTVKVEAARVRVIRLRGETSSPPLDITGQVGALQQQLLGNEAIMEMVLSLQQDPAMQEILADPAVMQAVLSGNAATLMTHPKFMELLAHPTIQAISKQLTK